jgi:hypothetical protein
MIIIDLSSLKKIGWSLFLYLFVYSGLEFNLTFLAHKRFNYNRFFMILFYFKSIFFTYPNCSLLQRTTRKNVLVHWHLHDIDSRWLCSTSQRRQTHQRVHQSHSFSHTWFCYNCINNESNIFLYWLVLILLFICNCGAMFDHSHFELW